jgi:hypothetical protein
MPWTELGLYWWFKDHDVLPTWVSGHDYRNFLQTHWSGLLEGLSFSVHPCKWFIHDGTSPHCSCIVHDWLFRNYPRWWIGRRCEAPVPWPACPYLCVCVCMCVVYVSVFADQGLCQVQSILGEKLWRQIQQFVSRTKNTVRILLSLLSFFHMQSWVLCPWTQKPFWAPVVSKWK